MNPLERNVIEVLNLICLLYRSRKQNFPKLSEEELGILVVTKEHIAMTGLSIPSFVNALNQIGRKGYLYGISIYEKKYHKLLKEIQTPTVYEKIMKELAESKKNSVSSEDKRRYFEPLIKALIPNKYINSTEEIFEEDITFSGLFEDSQKVLGGHSEDNISYVILSPYRKIERLLHKLNDGASFKEIKDQEIWFDPLTNNLYYLGGSIYLDKVKRAREVLLALFSQEQPKSILFYQIPESSRDEFNLKEHKAYYDSMNRVLKKDLKLKEIFELRQDRLELKPEYREQAH